MTSTAPATTLRDRYSDDQIASFYESGYWSTDSLYELIRTSAASRPDKVFVFDSTTAVTYAGLQESAVRVAAGLRRAGVAPGDRVAVQLPNWTEFVVIAAAIARAGAVIVPIMPIYRDKDVAYVLAHSGAKVAVTAEEFKGFGYLEMFRQIRPACEGLETVVITRGATAPGAGEIAWADLEIAGDIAELESEIGPDTHPDEPFLVVYTSGTTARPKGCHHTLNTIRSSAAAIARSLDYTEDDVQFGPSPITHSTGLVTSVLLPLLSGASSHLMEAWEPVEGMRRIKEHGCTVSVTATAFLQMMMAAYDPARDDLSSVRYWVCAGAPIPGSVVEKAGQMLSGGRVLSLYGRSENFLTTMCTSTDAPSRSVSSDGSALHGAEVRVVGPEGEEVPRGEEGDIAYRGPSHMIGYYLDPVETVALFTPDGFSRSGDLGRMDADGFVRVTGRLKDIVIRGGMNISAREIEDLVLAHPAVGTVAVVGMPDERLGEKVCLYVVPAAGAEPPTLESILDGLRAAKLPTAKLPERLEVVDVLPMTATGKIQKHLLREDIARKLG
ncbi:AMP-binding protein [Nakamurella sp. YIM 132087]|uniref:AMP-binding protein n=1 Tax=Nakamurella alba TaxID=2665158 RepID=A0A7K1FHV0_9ACTN|nr:AMP-binding protein [Nakamurella alba]MTD12454.1 AMP-binding protein [Nakamurella alba]